jgi:hypothetical protein
MSLLSFFRRISAPPALSHGNPLEGKRLRYLIGCDGDVTGKDGEIFVVGYDVDHLPLYGIGVGYCNLFDETNTGEYGPYLHSSDTAARYREGQIDPGGPGFERNLREQLGRRKAQGFKYVELDNPDAYGVADVLRAVRLAAAHTLAVLAKNPLLMEGDPTQYVAECCGVIVERGAGSPPDMDALRRRAGKPDMPVWFVAFGSGRSWAEAVARQARHFRNMYVTYSSAGEYGNSIDAELAP